MPNILVIHSNGAYSYTKRKQAEGVVDRGRAFWKDRGRTIIIMRRSTDDDPKNGYEYGGKKSYSVRGTVLACDLRTRTIIRVPIEQRDLTLTPVRDAGGAQVVQLKPLANRFSRGNHITVEDRLWRPERKRKARLP